MSQWSAIVYGRTWELDYRFLAIPEDFTDIDKQWARTYILETMHSGLKLYQRWSMFKNQKYCIIGLTYRIYDLIGENSLSEFDIRYDKADRYIYVFVGYVAKLSEKLDSLPFLLNETNIFVKLTLDIYIKIFKNRSSKHLTLFKYNIDLDSLELEKIECNNFNLNESFKIFTNIGNKIPPIILPYKKEQIKLIWQNFSQYILISQYYSLSNDISLCVGAENSDSIENFTTAIVLNKISDPVIGYLTNTENTPAINNKNKNKKVIIINNIKSIVKSIFKNIKSIIRLDNRKNIMQIIFILLIIQCPIIFLINKWISPLSTLYFLPSVFLISIIIAVFSCLIGVTLFLDGTLKK